MSDEEEYTPEEEGYTSEEEEYSSEEEIEEEEEPQLKKRKIYNFFIINPTTTPTPTPPLPSQKKFKQSLVEELEKLELANINFLQPLNFSTKTRQEIKFSKMFDSLDDLIKLGESYDPSIDYVCNLNIQKLHKAIQPIKELNSLIGLASFKKSILDQIVYLLTNMNGKDKPMLHTCIYGPPGCGKSQISNILAKIYSSCGILSTNKFKVIKREDLVAEYLGQTAVKTKKLLESMKGGVLFLDEAYSLGSDRNEDYFAKEAIDTLNVFLSENYSDFVFIIAGYEDQIKQCFFKQNQGLERRFPYRFTVEGYNPNELTLMFSKFISDDGWKIKLASLTDICSTQLFKSVDNCSTQSFKLNMEDFFREHQSSFPFYGGDLRTFLDKCKIIHTRRLITLEPSEWKILTELDIKEGYIMYLEERQIKASESPKYLSMYL